MSPSTAPYLIRGQGLAGTCLAWYLWLRKVDFRIIDSGISGSSKIAAGMINPVTGKNFEPSWKIEEFLPEATDFYRTIEEILGERLLHLLPVIRLAQTPAEWAKIQLKAAMPEVAPWIVGEVAASSDWAGAMELKGGGRLDMPLLVERTREFFQEKDAFVEAENVDACVIDCTGAAGLLSGSFGQQRCAKGEILTLNTPTWNEGAIQVGAGGWVVPIGQGLFKAGSTYEWNALDRQPTSQGREKIEGMVRRLMNDHYEVVDHAAEIRPILRRSQPLIGRTGDAWMFNGLGSKGALYAPGMARRLVEWMIDDKKPEPVFDFSEFQKHTP